MGACGLSGAVCDGHKSRNSLITFTSVSSSSCIWFTWELIKISGRGWGGSWRFIYLRRTSQMPEYRGSCWLHLANWRPTSDFERPIATGYLSTSGLSSSRTLPICLGILSSLWKKTQIQCATRCTLLYWCEGVLDRVVLVHSGGIHNFPVRTKVDDAISTPILLPIPSAKSIVGS